MKTIDLNYCTHLDKHLQNKKLENVFCITVTEQSYNGELEERKYFLAAETSYEMKTWVEQIDKLCSDNANIQSTHAGKSSYKSKL